jgi:phosphatidylserine decarboxylase
MITKYGYATIGVAVVITFILFASGLFIQNSFMKYAAFFIGAALLIFTLNFFRDPERTAPMRDDVVVSPADGTVLLVKTVEEPRFIGGEATQISIFMSPLNVHVNRIPITGKIGYLKYVEGKYLVASSDKASEENERSEIGIESKHGKVFFTQVAGFVARRIVYELNPGDSVKMGNRFGMIKFGSRVDVVVPGGWKTLVKPGDKTTAGETILFELDK